MALWPGAGGGAAMMARVGALVTLELTAESPLEALPWIITFGPLSDEEEWEPVVCGPYERPHALALAGSVVADEDLMAVVEPLLPHTAVEEIRGDIAAAKEAEAVAEAQARAAVEDEDEIGDDIGDGGEEDDEAGARMAPAVAPSPAEIKAGFGRIARRLTGQPG